MSSNHSAELRGFVTAIKEPGDEDKMGSDPWDIVAIDCEMIYTTCGNELARATFIGSKLQVLYVLQFCSKSFELNNLYNIF